MVSAPRVASMRCYLYVVQVKGTIDDVSKAEAVKRAAEEVSKRAEGARKAVDAAAENIGKSGAFKVASEGAASIKEEIEGHSLGGKVGETKPVFLRKCSAHNFPTGLLCGICYTRNFQSPVG